jgi:cell division protein FtsB
MVTLEQTIDARWQIHRLSDGSRKLIRVPVAVLGEWQHPEYGDLSFTQRDFDDIKQNWQTNVLGYEPPLFIGHSTDERVFGGEPAVAFQTDLVQEGDVLYGIYDPVDEEALKDVESGIYRYSSSETYRNATCKETGRPVGTILTGMALTNRPFLTRLPRVEVIEQQLSEPTDNSLVSFVFPIQESSMSEQPQAATPAAANPETAARTAAEVAEQFSKLAEVNDQQRQQIDQLLAENAALRQESEASKLQLSQLSEQVGVIVDRAKKQDLSDKQRKIAAFNLPKGVKEEFIAKLSEGFFTPEQEEFQFKQLQMLSEANRVTYTQPQGNPVLEEELTDANPYAAAIQQNLKLAQSRRQQSQVL